LIVTQGPQRLKRHVAPLQLPLVVLLEQQRADEPLDLGIEPLERIGAVDLRAMDLGEGHEREHVGFCAIHQLGKLRELAAQLIGVRERVTEKVHLATLPGGGEHLGGRGLDPLVGIGDHQLHATQPAARQ